MGRVKKQGLSVEDIMATYGSFVPEDVMSTGLDVLDDIFGGGISLQGCYGFWGDAGCGKSTIACQIARYFCSQGLRVCYIDTELALNDRQLRTFGLSEFKESQMLIHLSCSDMSQLEEIASVIPEMDIKLLIIDSWSMISPYVEKGMSVKDCRPGLKALQTSFLLPKLKQSLHNLGVAFIVLFHARANLQMGIVNPNAPTRKQEGGFSARHIPDLLLKVEIVKKLTNGDVTTGNVLKMSTLEKNKFSQPSVVTQKLFFGLGMSNKISTIDRALELGIIEQSGSMYTLPSGEKFRGIAALYDAPSEVISPIRESVLRVGWISNSI